MAIPSDKTLLVTGANGFIAQHIIKQALDRGYNIQATVRSVELADKVHRIFSDYSFQFSAVIISDLSKRSFTSPFANTPKPIKSVIQVASPFRVAVADVAADILDPALGGAIGALKATRQYGSSVRRFVLASCFVAMLDLGKRLRPGYTYKEKDWNPMTWEEAIQMGGAAAYCASKALTERTVWNWMEAEKPPLFAGLYHFAVDIRASSHAHCRLDNSQHVICDAVADD